MRRHAGPGHGRRRRPPGHLKLSSHCCQASQRSAAVANPWREPIFEGVWGDGGAGGGRWLVGLGENGGRRRGPAGGPMDGRAGGRRAGTTITGPGGRDTLSQAPRCQWPAPAQPSPAQPACRGRRQRREPNLPARRAQGTLGGAGGRRKAPHNCPPRQKGKRGGAWMAGCPKGTSVR